MTDHDIATLFLTGPVQLTMADGRQLDLLSVDRPGAGADDLVLHASRLPVKCDPRTWPLPNITPAIVRVSVDHPRAVFRVVAAELAPEPEGVAA